MNRFCYWKWAVIVRSVMWLFRVCSKILFLSCCLLVWNYLNWIVRMRNVLSDWRIVIKRNLLLVFEFWVFSFGWWMDVVVYLFRFSYLFGKWYVFLSGYYFFCIWLYRGECRRMCGFGWWNIVKRDLVNLFRYVVMDCDM